MKSLKLDPWNLELDWSSSHDNIAYASFHLRKGIKLWIRLVLGVLVVFL